MLLNQEDLQGGPDVPAIPAGETVIVETRFGHVRVHGREHDLFPARLGRLRRAPRLRPGQSAGPGAGGFQAVAVAPRTARFRSSSCRCRRTRRRSMPMTSRKPAKRSGCALKDAYFLFVCTVSPRDNGEGVDMSINLRAPIIFDVTTRRGAPVRVPARPLCHAAAGREAAGSGQSGVRAALRARRLLRTLDTIVGYRSMTMVTNTSPKAGAKQNRQQRRQAARLAKKGQKGNGAAAPAGTDATVSDIEIAACFLRSGDVRKGQRDLRAVAHHASESFRGPARNGYGRDEDGTVFGCGRSFSGGQSRPTYATLSFDLISEAHSPSLADLRKQRPASGKPFR